MSCLALLTGMGLGLVIFQLMAALFAAILEIPFAVSAYSGRGVLLTVAVSAGLFVLSTLASLRYLKKVTVSELLKEAASERSEKHPVLWCVLSAVALAGFAACLVITYRSLMAAFHKQDGVALLLWLVIDLVMVFLTHFTLSRTLAGMLLRSRRLKNKGTNTVVLRGLSGKMTMNYLLIGAALVLFYLMLLSLAEWIGFGLAYIVSAVLILGMIALYLNAIVHDKKTVTAICLFMGLVDVFIYILLSIADMALLVGTFGLFIILGVAMFFSLKIKFQRKPADAPVPVEVKDNVSEAEE